MADSDVEVMPEEATGPSAELVRAVAEAVASADKARILELVQDLRAPDLADIIELLTGEERVGLIQILGSAFDYEVLSELDETRSRPALRGAAQRAPRQGRHRARDRTTRPTSSKASRRATRRRCSAQLATSDRAALERNLEYPEETAGRLMQADFVAVPPFWTVGQVIDHMRETDELPGDVLGNLRRRSRPPRARRRQPVAAAAHKAPRGDRQDHGERPARRAGDRGPARDGPPVRALRSYERARRRREQPPRRRRHRRRRGRGHPGRGRRGHEAAWSASATKAWPTAFSKRSRSRVPWLIVNLGTAMLASTVIQVFGGTIQQMVALAVLMPIVASIGGNAGTQTMTVTVRALATAKLGAVNAPRVITREALVGLINGLVMSLIAAAVVFFWFGSGKLGARHRGGDRRQSLCRGAGGNSHSAGLRPLQARSRASLGRVRDHGDGLRRVLRVPGAGGDVAGVNRTNRMPVARVRSPADWGGATGTTIYRYEGCFSLSGVGHSSARDHDPSPRSSAHSPTRKMPR